MSFCRFIWPLLVQPFHELFWHRQDIAAPMPQQVKKPSCHCSCSLALIWDWEWVWEWCVYALFNLLEMEQCFDIMIPCDDLEINFLQNVFQTNKYPYCLYMMTGNPYFIFLPLKSRSNYVLFWDQWVISSSNQLKWEQIEKKYQNKKRFFSVTTMSTRSTSNCYYRQTIWQKPLKFWYKKRQTICYKRKKRRNHNIDYERHTINLE